MSSPTAWQEEPLARSQTTPPTLCLCFSVQTFARHFKFGRGSNRYWLPTATDYQPFQSGQACQKPEYESWEQEEIKSNKIYVCWREQPCIPGKQSLSSYKWRSTSLNISNFLTDFSFKHHSDASISFPSIPSTASTIPMGGNTHASIFIYCSAQVPLTYSKVHKS